MRAGRGRSRERMLRRDGGGLVCVGEWIVDVCV